MFTYDYTSLFGIAPFAFGLVLGSFFNVLIWRLPRGESIVSPGSHCPSCGRPVKPLENVPVLSFIALRGKCAGCGCRISPRYPAVELVTAVALTLLWGWIAGRLADFPADQRVIRGIELAVVAAGLLLLIPISVIDFQHMLIHDVFTLPGLAAGLALSFLPGGITPLESVAGAATGGGLLLLAGLFGEFVLRKRDAMGGGDVKLLAWAGSLLGWEAVLVAIILASFLGALAGGILLLFRRLNAEHRIPFGPFLAAGLWLAALAGHTMVTWYFGRLDKLLGL